MAIWLLTFLDYFSISEECFVLPASFVIAEQPWQSFFFAHGALSSGRGNILNMRSMKSSAATKPVMDKSLQVHHDGPLP